MTKFLGIVFGFRFVTVSKKRLEKPFGFLTIISSPTHLRNELKSWASDAN